MDWVHSCKGTLKWSTQCAAKNSRSMTTPPYNPYRGVAATAATPPPPTCERLDTLPSLGWGPDPSRSGWLQRSQNTLCVASKDPEESLGGFRGARRPFGWLQRSQKTFWVTSEEAEELLGGFRGARRASRWLSRSCSG